MKRRFLLALSILTNSCIAYAQEAEDAIMGLNISSLLVILPILMIVLGMMFFVGLYIKDHYADISRFFKIKFKRKKEIERKKRIIDYPKEVQELQKKILTIEPKEALQNLSHLAKRFFAEKFNIDYEFTHGELEKELKKEKESWAEFPRKLSDLRYSGEAVSKKEVKELVKEFWDIVKYEKRAKLSLTVVEKLKKRRLGFEIEILKNLKRYLQKEKPAKVEKLTTKDVVGYFIKRQKQRVDNLFSILRKVKEDMVHELKAPLRTAEKVEEYVSQKVASKRIEGILNLIEETRKQLRAGSRKKAKEAYKKAYYLYSKLPIEEQTPIIDKLHELQKDLYEIKKQPTIKRTFADQVKEYLTGESETKRKAKLNELIEETQKQITKGNINQAKKAYKTAYYLYYKLPLEDQPFFLSHLRNIGDQIDDAEKSVEQLELEELSQELNKLKSEKDIYVIFDKSEVAKKLNFLAKYAQKVEQQGAYGLEAGKDHIKEKLKDLTESAKEIEEKEEKKLTKKEKSLISKIKDIGLFYAKKEADLEKAFKQKQKQIFDKFQTIKRPQKEELKPKIPPSPKLPIGKDEIEILKDITILLSYLKIKKDEGLYQLMPTGQEFLNKIETFVKIVRERETKGLRVITLNEKEFLDGLKLFTKKEGPIMHPLEKERRVLEFIEHMKERGMVNIEDRRLQREKERVQAPPSIKKPKVKMNIKRLKELQSEEEKLMQQIQESSVKHPPPLPRIQRKKLERYSWEIMADEVRKRKTKDMTDLTKEEEEILSKLNELEE